MSLINRIIGNADIIFANQNVLMNTRMVWDKLLSNKKVSQFDNCSTPIKKSQYKDPRSDFERDYDQIIYSYPFRRLQDKTQVIPFPEYDFVHTRLTHSLEVASVGRSLGKLVADIILKELDPAYKNERNLTQSDIGDLVAAACLAHDMGNPPFGHSGEDSISFYFKQNPQLFEYINSLDIVKEDEMYVYSETFHHPIEEPELHSYNKQEYLNKMKRWIDVSKFEGNANGFRILVKNCDKGINPTAALLGAFTKYPRESYLHSLKLDNLPKSLSKYGFFQSEREFFKQLANELGLIKVAGIAEEELAFYRHPLSFLMEAADDIAYGMIDFEDGCRLGLIDFDKKYRKIKVLNKQGNYEEEVFDSSPSDILVNIASLDDAFDKSKIEEASDFKESISYLRSKIINVLTHECFNVFERNYEDIMTGKYQNSLIEDIENQTIKDSLRKMKKLVRKFVYNYPPVLQSEASGFEVMYNLIDSYAISSNICFTCGESETEKAKKLSSLLPEEYRPRVENENQNLTFEEKYNRIISVLDYVSGMTDNYAMSLYRKIKGISHR